MLSKVEPPEWAVRLLSEIWEEYGDGKPQPEVTWRTSTHFGTSGRYYATQHRFVITAGTDKADLRRAVVHETAHALTPGHQHDEIYWRMFWIIVYGRGLVLREVMRSELEYRTLSIIIAAEVGVRGAKKVWAEYQRQLKLQREERKRCNQKLTHRTQ